MQTQDVWYFYSPLYIFEAEIANFTSIKLRILKDKFNNKLRKLFGLVKKDYEILYQRFLSGIKTDNRFCYECGMLLKKLFDF